VVNTAVASRTEAAWRVLAGVLDPEVPALSVVDLGIVRGVEEHSDGALEIVLTPTYSGCPAVEVIEADIIAALDAAALGPVRVRTQRAPAWTTDWISDAGRRKLRDYGIAPPGRVRAGAPIRVFAVRPEPVEGLAAVRPRLRQAQPERDVVVSCPRCASTHTERLSAFGATACKALYRCIDCREPFEHFKPI
jgi:ring-1,2-phenylacetyl-CoA epoxidase subunit PaaD